eukprot:295135_1
MNIIYKYDNNNKIIKHFKTKQARKMLIDTNLILQYVDQRKMDDFQKGLIIYIDMTIKYQYMSGDGNESQIRFWEYNLHNHKVIEIASRFNAFDWRISNDTILTFVPLYVSNLWITNISHVSCVPRETTHNGECKIYCKGDILIDSECSISMDGCGVTGAVFNEEKKESMYKIDVKYNGKSIYEYGGGAGYKETGNNSYDEENFIYADQEDDAGCKYLTDEKYKINYFQESPMKNKANYEIFSIGFGGGCG